jgi:hypothetical protein
MKRALTIAFGAAAALAGGTGYLFAQSGPAGQVLLGRPYLFRIAPAQLYPDRALTPGKADTFSAAGAREASSRPRTGSAPIRHRTAASRPC